MTEQEALENLAASVRELFASLYAMEVTVELPVGVAFPLLELREALRAYDNTCSTDHEALQDALAEEFGGTR